MPCFAIQLNSVDFNITNLEELKKALAAKGMSAYQTETTLVWVDSETRARVSLTNGKLRIPGYISETELVNRTKRIYSEHVVKTMAARMGWKTQTKANKIFATKGY